MQPIQGSAPNCRPHVRREGGREVGVWGAEGKREGGRFGRGEVQTGERDEARDGASARSLMLKSSKACSCQGCVSQGRKLKYLSPGQLHRSGYN